MDQTTLDRLLKLEHQMGALIDILNRLECAVERHGFDIAFIYAYITERRAQDASDG